MLDLLLLDEANPRSVAFQLARLREHIEQLPESLADPPPAPRRAIAVRLLTAVQLAEVAELVRDQRRRATGAIWRIGQPSCRRARDAFRNPDPRLFQPRHSLAAVVRAIIAGRSTP